MHSSMIIVSVIIPTYKDWESLRGCLEALSLQTYKKECFEILVVNNAPEDKAPEDFIFPENCILLNESKPGSYAARNKGLDHAQGDIIAFTDSDCIPERIWISAFVATIEDEKNQGYNRFAGNIILYTRGNKDLGYWHDVVHAFKQKRNASEGKSVTANMVLKRDIIDKVGRFDETLMSGGDFEWNVRASTKGEPLLYMDNCIVLHPTRSLNSIFLKNRRKYSKNYSLIHKNRILSFFKGIKLLKPSILHLKEIIMFKDLKLIIKIKLLILIIRIRIVVFIEHYRLLFGGSVVRS